MIKIEDFQKLDLRVAEIKSVEEIEGAAKLYKLKIDLGERKPETDQGSVSIREERQLVAGIKAHYTPDELVGKKIIVIANLEPAKLRGVESQGMLLAASTENKEQVVVLTVDKDVPNGSKIS